MNPRPRIITRFEGPAVEAGGVPVDDLVGVLTHFQLAVRRMVEEVAGRRPTAGRIPETIRSAGSLSLVQTSRGSFVAELELDDRSVGLLPDLGVIAIERLLAGMTRPGTLPARVVREIGLIRDSLRGGIDAVSFASDSDVEPVVIRRDMSLPAPAPESIEHATSFTGRILEVDWKDRTAELYTAAGVVNLVFDESMAGLFRDLALREVTVRGDLRQHPDGRATRVVVDSIAPELDDLAFWAPPSIEELAREQRVEPFMAPGEFTSKSDEADELLAAIFG